MLVMMRTQGLDLAGAIQRHLERRVRTALRSKGGKVRAVTVSLSDVNGPRGGEDLHCAVTIELLPRGSVRGEASDSDVLAAIARALARARRAAGGVSPERRRRARRIAAANGGIGREPFGEPVERTGGRRFRG